MYPSADEKSAIDDAERLMVETMARYDCSHDKYHVQRVRKTALTIANALENKPDLLVVEIAALLHDVLDRKYVSAEQAADPYGFFVPFFKDIASKTSIDLIKDSRALKIARIIENVSWSTEKKLRKNGEWSEWHQQCVELHCVQDADRLDAIGCFGVMRCAAFSATKDSVLYAPKGDPAEATSAIQHFKDKLVHIYDKLKTLPGKSMGLKRNQLIVNFIEAVEDEYNAVIP